MEELFAELEEELRSAKKEMRNLKKEVKIQLSIVMPPIQPTIVFCDGPSFPKAERFKSTSNNQDSVFGDSVYSEGFVQEYINPEAYEAIQVKKPRVVFSKSQRFVQPKIDYPAHPLEPNYDFIRKNAPSISICPEKQSHYSAATKKLLESGITNLYELETQASMSQVGPGAYSVNYDCVDVKKSFAIPKEQRFRDALQLEQSTLNPNYDTIRKRPPTAKISRKTDRNKQLIERDMMRDAEMEQQAQYFRQRPIDVDGAIRVKAPSAFIMKSFKEISAEAAGSKQRMYYIRKLLDELKYQSLGPGAYNPAPFRPAPCTVVYRPHSAETRKLPSDNLPTPGPDYYYSKDDLIRTTAIVHSFGTEARIKSTRKEDLDMRPNLNINVDAIKPRAPATTIAPEKETFALIPAEDPILEQRRGPAAYDPRTLGPRTDMGAVTLQPITEKNDRANTINLFEKEVHDYNELLLPSLDPIKPHAAAFKYYQATEHGPQHIPDKELFPEQHPFYDVNIDAVRENIAQAPHFGGRAGRGLVEFLRYQEHIDEFKGYMQRLSHGPMIGQYEVKYGAVDPNAKMVDFDRYQERDNEPIQKSDGDVPGDNLILNPQLLPKHLPNIDFEKQMDRPEGPRPKNGPELNLDLNVDAIKPRVKQVMQFEKQLDRPPSPKMKEMELLLDVQFVKPRVKGAVDFEKQVDRGEDPRFVDKVDDRPLVVEVKYDKKVKGAVKMEQGGDRFKRSSEKKSSVPPPVSASRMEKVEKYMRPNIPGVNMKATSGRIPPKIPKKI